MEVLVEYIGKGLMIMLAISMPCVLMAAAVGLVVGILQAVTQVQEQTIAAAPKIVIVFLTIVILGGYFIKILTNFIFEGANIAFNVVPKNESFVLPADYYKYTRPFADEMKDEIGNPKTNKALVNQGKIQWDKSAKTKAPIYINANQVPAVEPNFIERLKIQKGK